MAFRAKWDDEDDDGAKAVPAPAVALRRGRFSDEEEDDSDVPDAWDDEDSEAELEKAKKAEAAAAAKAKADAEAAANKKSRAERARDHQATRAHERAAAGDDDESDSETEAQKRERLRRTEKESDLSHATDLFGDMAVGAARAKTSTVGTAVQIDPADPSRVVNLAALPLFNPNTKPEFDTLCQTLAPILLANAKKAQYALFLKNFAKELVKELSSDDMKKIASVVTAAANEKMKAEKAADKGGKKSKAAKTKSNLVINRPSVTDTAAYGEDAFGDDDFM